MKLTKRIAGIGLSACLIATALTGCGGGTNDSSKSDDSTTVSTPVAGSDNALVKQYPAFADKHKVKVSCVEMGWTGPQKENDIVTPEIAKRTGLEFEYEPITVNTFEDMNQKLNLMIASKEIPDIFMGMADTYTLEVYDRLGTNDLIWDIGEKIKKYENIYNLVKPELTMYQTDSGANYFLPTQTGKGNDITHTPPGGLHFRTDFLAKLNMEIPTTPEDLYTYLKRCKEELGVKIPMSFGENLSGIQWSLLVPFFTDFYNTDIFGLAFDSENNYKVVNQEYSNSPEMMRACKFINKLYQEKLLDNEILTHKDAQFREKASNGEVACLPGNWWDINAFTDAARTVTPEAELVYSRIYDKANVPAEKYDKAWTNNVGMFSTLIFSKSIDEEAVDHMLSVLDYLATKDGQLLVQMGIEGVSFEYDANGKAKFTEKFKTDTNNLEWNAQAAYGVAYLAQFVFNFPAYQDLIDEFPALIREDNQKSYANDPHIKKYDPNMEPTPNYYFVAGPVEIAKMSAISSDAHNELLVNVMLAKSEAEVEKLVNDYGETCKKLGIDEIVAERQAFIDDFIAKNKK